MNRKGFTLIELLVVIAIIGLLSTLAIVALGTARLKSRDARRLSDLKSIQTALELFAGDNNGSYPVMSTITLGDATHACLGSNGFNAAGGCANAYIAALPRDPSGGHYLYNGTANNYIVSAVLEGAVNGLSGQISATPNSGIAHINFIANDYEANVSGVGSDSVGETIEVSSDFAYFGSKSIKWTYGTSGTENIYNDANGSPSANTFTVTIYVRKANGAPVAGLSMYLYIGANQGSVTPIIIPVGNGWYKVVGTRTVAVAGVLNLTGLSGLDNTQANYIDGWMAEVGP